MLTKGWDCHFHGDPSCCDLSYHGSALGSISLQNHLCFLDFEFLHFNEPLPILQAPVLITAFAHVAVTHNLWHAHLGHVGGEAACHVTHFADESCIVGKHPSGPMPVQTPHRCHYFLVILDDFTHTLDLQLLTMKDLLKGPILRWVFLQWT